MAKAEIDYTRLLDKAQIAYDGLEVRVKRLKTWEAKLRKEFPGISDAIVNGVKQLAVAEFSLVGAELDVKRYERLANKQSDGATVTDAPS